MSASSSKPHGPEGVSTKFNPSPYVTNILSRLENHFSRARSAHFLRSAAADFAVESFLKEKNANQDNQICCGQRQQRAHLPQPNQRESKPPTPSTEQLLRVTELEKEHRQLQHTSVQQATSDSTQHPDQLHHKSEEKTAPQKQSQQQSQQAEQLQQIRGHHGMSASHYSCSMPPSTTGTRSSSSSSDGTGRAPIVPTTEAVNTANQPFEPSSTSSILSMRPREPCCSSNHCEGTRSRQRETHHPERYGATEDLGEVGKLCDLPKTPTSPYIQAKMAELESSIISMFQMQYQRLDRAGKQVSPNPNKQPPLQSEKECSSMFGCSHYARNCKLKASCCGLFVSCRFCHDEAMCGDHEMDRFSIEAVLCLVCHTEQPISQRCISCGVMFGHYYCSECRFFENSPGAKIYHCAKCNICRVGKGLGIDNYHCEHCDSCVSLKSRDHHRCRKNSLRANCPICTEYLFTSREPVVFMRCGHGMHSRCFDEYTLRSYQCPLCMSSLTDMSSYFQRLDEIVAADPMPPEYSNKRSSVFCNDCTKKTIVNYHFDYHKCGVQSCGSYNTKVLDTFEVDTGADDSGEKEIQRDDNNDEGGGGGANQRSDGEDLQSFFHNGAGFLSSAPPSDEDEEMLPADGGWIFRGSVELAV